MHHALVEEEVVLHLRMNLIVFLTCFKIFQTYSCLGYIMWSPDEDFFIFDQMKYFAQSVPFLKLRQSYKNAAK